MSPPISPITIRRSAWLLLLTIPFLESDIRSSGLSAIFRWCEQTCTAEKFLQQCSRVPFGRCFAVELLWILNHGYFHCSAKLRSSMHQFPILGRVPAAYKTWLCIRYARRYDVTTPFTGHPSKPSRSPAVKFQFVFRHLVVDTLLSCQENNWNSKFRRVFRVSSHRMAWDMHRVCSPFLGEKWR